jgi:Transcription elongation factor, GreA/GreB, C-term
VVPVADAHSLQGGGRLPGGLDDEDALAIARRVGPTLDALAVAYQLEIRGYLARGGPRRRARRIAATVVRVARQTGAEVIAVGQRHDRAPAGASVPARIAKGASAHVLVSFARPAPRRSADAVRSHADGVPAAAGDLAGVARAGRPVGDPSEVILTRQGRHLLAARARRLRAHVLPELRAALADRARDERGDAVEIAGGSPERFLIVHPVEAPLDDTRISAHSPLARALLGRRIGDDVEVHAPGGAYRCRILAAERGTSGPRRVR